MILDTLIVECTPYDFKLMLEEKKPKSWQKSVSAFANGSGGYLFFGIDNDGIVRRFDDVRHIMAPLDNMELRGDKLKRIRKEIKILDECTDELKPKFKSTPSLFQTIIYATADTPNVGDHDGNVSETKFTERQQKILNLVKESPVITGRQMSETLSVSQRTIERDLSTLQKKGILKHEGKDNDGVWVVLGT